MRNNLYGKDFKKEARNLVEFIGKEYGELDKMNKKYGDSFEGNVKKFDYSVEWDEFGDDSRIVERARNSLGNALGIDSYTSLASKCYEDKKFGSRSNPEDGRQKWNGESTYKRFVMKQKNTGKKIANNLIDHLKKIDFPFNEDFAEESYFYKNFNEIKRVI